MFKSCKIKVKWSLQKIIETSKILKSIIESQDKYNSKFKDYLEFYFSDHWSVICNNFNEISKLDPISGPKLNNFEYKTLIEIIKLFMLDESEFKTFMMNLEKVRFNDFKTKLRDLETKLADYFITIALATKVKFL